MDVKSTIVKLKTQDILLCGKVVSTGKVAFLAPAYLSVAWCLMISYQLFTQIAVTTVIGYVDLTAPSIGNWLVSRVDTLVFIYAFAWVFLLSSAVPSLILGKERGVLIQFLVCLGITMTALLIQDFLFYEQTVDQMLNISALFHNPILAGLYLTVPFAIMIAIDLKSRRKKKLKDLEEITEDFPERTYVAEEEQSVPQ